MSGAAHLFPTGRKAGRSADKRPAWRRSSMLGPAALLGGFDQLSPMWLWRAISPALPPVLHGLRLWISVSLAIYVAFQLELDDPVWAGTTAAFTCQTSLGMSFHKGWFGMMGTILGAV